MTMKVQILFLAVTFSAGHAVRIHKNSQRSGASQMLATPDKLLKMAGLDQIFTDYPGFPPRNLHVPQTNEWAERVKDLSIISKDASPLKQDGVSTPSQQQFQDDMVHKMNAENDVPSPAKDGMKDLPIISKNLISALKHDGVGALLQENSESMVSSNSTNNTMEQMLIPPPHLPIISKNLISALKHDGVGALLQENSKSMVSSNSTNNTMEQMLTPPPHAHTPALSLDMNDEAENVTSFSDTGGRTGKPNKNKKKKKKKNKNKGSGGDGEEDTELEDSDFKKTFVDRCADNFDKGCHVLRKHVCKYAKWFGGIPCPPEDNIDDSVMHK